MIPNQGTSDSVRNFQRSRFPRWSLAAREIDAYRCVDRQRGGRSLLKLRDETILPSSPERALATRFSYHSSIQYLRSCQPYPQSPITAAPPLSFQPRGLPLAVPREGVGARTQCWNVAKNEAFRSAVDVRWPSFEFQLECCSPNSIGSLT